MEAEYKIFVYLQGEKSVCTRSQEHEHHEACTLHEPKRKHILPQVSKVMTQALRQGEAATKQKTRESGSRLTKLAFV